MTDSTRDGLQRLKEVVAKLRSPEGCPWDRAQTSISLIPYLIEETYEVVEAIEKEDHQNLREELGDLLLHVVFQAQLAAEKNLFQLEDVVKNIVNKLINRHPHVFGPKASENTSAAEALHNWERGKLNSNRKSLLDGVPKNLPALIRAQRIQMKASEVGFDWNDVTPALDKLQEEIEELNSARESNKHQAVMEELGDVLFSIVNVARLLGYDAETALRAAVDKFERRFKRLEQQFNAEGKDLSAATLAEMDAVWDDIKNSDSHSQTAKDTPRSGG